MAIKYQCRKCGKRYVDWGAEKLGFKCPDCDGEELVRGVVAEEKAVRRPAALKRKPRRVPGSHLGESDYIVPDIEEIEAEEVDVEYDHDGDESEVFLPADDDAGHDGLDIDDVVPADELAETDTSDLALGEELPFADATPPIAGEEIDEPVPEADEWTE
jgi:DNA-directed RNA polymerase subunit RPC12/RpoP